MQTIVDWGGGGWGTPLQKARGGDGGFPWGRAGLDPPLLLYVSLPVPVVCTDVYWCVLMYICMFTDIDGL